MFEAFYFSVNVINYPTQAAITKLSYPRLFVRFSYEDSVFANYEFWREKLVDVQWIDGERPSEEEEEEILKECWDFMVLHEEEEERIAESDDDDF